MNQIRKNYLPWEDLGGANERSPQVLRARGTNGNCPDNDALLRQEGGERGRYPQIS
jgi:hypothetical protein